jgi:transposase-like protein
MSSVKSTKKEKTQDKPPVCPKCRNKHTIKSGMVQGEQRWKCKECSFQYTRIIPRGRPVWQKSLAVFLYSYGVSLHAIARMFDVQASTVLKWVRIYAKDHNVTPENGSIKMLNLAEMGAHLKDATDNNSSTLFISINDEIFKEGAGIAIDNSALS